jgi:hypothetical protein
MKKKRLLALSLILLLPLALSACGGQAKVGSEEEVARYALNNILVPKEQDTSFIVEWRRKSTGPEDVSPEELAQKFWKWEGSSLVEISAEEYKSLAAQRQGGDPKKWVYNEHSVTVEELDQEKGEATVEIGSIYGPMTGAGIQYSLRKQGGEWRTVDEETVWMT